MQETRGSLPSCTPTFRVHFYATISGPTSADNTLTADLAHVPTLGFFDICHTHSVCLLFCLIFFSVVGLMNIGFPPSLLVIVGPKLKVG
ncbi:hypothetical protein OAA19_00075 [Rubripirellula sp.]|nr:hypothetical protein [Rubripirellula sp.]MDB4338482.1 hypothetical protein [Rubripirellula sp.]